MLASAAWLVPAILGGINVIAQHRLDHETGPLPWRAIIFDSTDWLLYAVLTPGVFWLGARFPRRYGLHLLFSLLFCAAWAAGGSGIRILLHQQPSYLSWVFITFPFGVAVYFGMLGIEHATRYFVEARDSQAQLQAARFAALEARLNPHFLFNTLNTVNVLIRDGERGAATRMVEQLSDLLRRTLRPDRPAEVPLADELELVRGYLAIEQVRFSDRLRVSYDIPRATEPALIPSFALQHLVENAVRHGIARRSEPGTVTIAARQEGEMLIVSVSDDGPGITPAGSATTGHGLDNTRRRLAALHGDRASLRVEPRTDGGTTATLRLPWHE